MSSTQMFKTEVHIFEKIHQIEIGCIRHTADVIERAKEAGRSYNCFMIAPDTKAQIEVDFELTLTLKG